MPHLVLSHEKMMYSMMARQSICEEPSAAKLVATVAHTSRLIQGAPNI
jgi:hypothetical protein